MKRTALIAKAPLIGVAVAACLLLSAGVASAKYFRDGTVQDGTTGTWKLPTDFVCIKGIDATGNITVAAGITSSRDCIYYNTGLTGMNPVDVTTSSMCGASLLCNVQANCTGTNSTTKGTLTWNATDSKCYDSAPCTIAGFAGGTFGGITFPANTGGKHALATSICVDGSGNGLSLTGLDRTSQMCTARGGIWKQTASPATAGFGGACVAFTRQFKGQDATGTPLAFGAKGTTQGAGTGYCYTTMNMTTAYSTATACPSNQAAVAPFNADAAYDWSFSSSKCTYAKGIAGYLNANLTHADGTTTGTTAGTFVDLSVLAPTMGDCLALGASWNNWTGQASTSNTACTAALTPYACCTGSGAGTCPTLSVSTTPLASTIPAWDYTKQSPDADEGCLHCHSTTVEYNGPAERFKSSYIMTGHKNMLRKVDPAGGANNKWAGPDAEGVLQIYTGWASGTLDFSVPSATNPTAPWTYPLLYIFGDWMAPAPAGLDVIVNVSGTAKYNGTSNYSCAPCHSTGWSDNGTAAATRIGLCVPSSAGTTQSACTTGGGTWYPAIGVKGIGNSAYVPQEPAASFPGISFTGAGQWDIEGINCSRCHNTAIGPTNATMIAASQYKTTYPQSGGMGNIPGGPEAAGVYGAFLCFGCHQQIPKNNNGVGADNDLANIQNIQVANAVTTGTCTDPSKTSEAACQAVGAIWTPTSYVPTAPGGKHVLGEEFLNSVHAEATGTLVPNSLGKYDLVTNLNCTGAGAPLACCTGAGTGTCITFGSSFKGYTCWQSSSSSSPALTWIDPTLTTLAACEAAEGEMKAVGCVREIKDKTTCENLYGAGAWRAASQGSCVTCHDVHNSLFVVGQEEKAMRKTCQNCHVDNATTSATVATAPQIPGIAHLTGSGTPFDTSMGESPCIVCHMPKPTSGDFPMHLWRINTDPAYSSFPSAAQYGAGTTPTKKIMNASPDGAYASAVWVDLDLACGQCHGGGDVEDAQHEAMVDQCTSAGTPYACCTGLASGSCAKYRTKEALAPVAETMHSGSSVGGQTYPTTFSASVSALTVNLNASVLCNGCTLTYDWDCPGSTTPSFTTAVPTASCTYTTAGTKAITLTAMENGGQAGTVTRSVTLTAAGAAPPVPGGLNCATVFNATTWTASFTDASTPVGSQVVVEWGDGARSFGTASSPVPLSHTYASAGSFLIVQKVINSALQMGPLATCGVIADTFTVSGHIYKADGTTPLGAATVSLRSATTGNTIKTVYTFADGSFSMGSLAPGSYWLAVSKRGYTFPPPTTTGNPAIPVAGNVTGISIKANP